MQNIYAQKIKVSDRVAGHNDIWKGPKWLSVLFRRFGWIQALQLHESVVKYQDVSSKKLEDAIWELCLSLYQRGIEPKKLLIGYDDWAEFTGNLDKEKWHSIIQYNFQGVKIYNLSVVVIPYMKGWIVV